MSASGEPPLVVNTGKVTVLESSMYLAQYTRESPDVSKASPSNGQCPTAVSSRNQTIASREITRPQRIGSQSNTPTDYQPTGAGIVVIKQDQFRPLQSSQEISVGTAGDQVDSTMGGGGGGKHLSKQFTFKDARPQQHDTSSFNSSVEEMTNVIAGNGMREYVQDNNSQRTQMLIKDKATFEVSQFAGGDFSQRKDPINAISARNNRDSRDDNLRIMRQSNQGSETVSYKLKMKNNAVGATDSTRERQIDVNEPSSSKLTKNAQLLQNDAAIELNKSHALQQDGLMATDRSISNQSPQSKAQTNYKPEESIQSKTFDAQVYHITGYDQTEEENDGLQQTADFNANFAQNNNGSRPIQSLTQPSVEDSFEQNKPVLIQRKVVKVKQTTQQPLQQPSVETPTSQQINSVRGTRDESPSFFKDHQQQIRNQQQRLSQPDCLKSAAAGSRQDSSKRGSPKQNARTFIIRNTNGGQQQLQPVQHQPKVLPPVNRQPINKKSAGVKTPLVNLNGGAKVLSKGDKVRAESKQNSPSGMDHNDASGNIRRLSQNQNSINMYLEQESKFDSTKDASEFMGGVRDCTSSLPDSIKVKGGGQDRSYDEAWPIDQGSQNSCQHGEGSCDQRLDSAQTSFLNKRRPSANRLNQDFFDHSVQKSEEMEQLLPAPGTGKSKKHMQQMSQPRTKDYARRAASNNLRGTLQSQNNQSSFVDDIEEEYSSKHHHHGQQSRGGRADSSHGSKQKNYHSPVHLREIGLSQQMVPNQMKQQLKQRRTVYGQSFFNSPPYPPAPLMNQDMVDPMVAQQQQLFDNSQVNQKPRNTQIDSSLRRKRQLPVPQYPPQQQIKQHQGSGVMKLSSNQEILQTRNSMQQSIPLQLQSQMTHQPIQQPQSQQRRTLQRHFDSTTQHLEFDERNQNNEGKISQLSRFNQYHAGMRNVLTAGENSPRVVDHFPVSRASRWKGQGGPNGGSNNYDVMQLEMENGIDSQGHRNPIMPLQEDRGGQYHTGSFHNSKNLPKRSGTASYITQGGVRITINKDNKHLNGANLTTETEENMNLMFYDFNNAKVVAEENQRNLLRSQTTDRGPSRKLRSRGRFKLASSNQQKRGEDTTGFGEIRPFEVSTEFEMGMYPPPPGCNIGPPGMDFNTEQLQSHHGGHVNGLETAPHGSPHQLESAGNNHPKNSKSGNRNIQGKRLSSQTTIQRSAQGGRSHSGQVSAMISSNQGYEQQHSASPNNNTEPKSLAHSSGQRRVKKYRADSGYVGGPLPNEGQGNAGVAAINRSLPKKNFVPGPGLGQRGELFRNYSREGAAKRGEHAQMHQQPKPVKPLSRIPQHRQTNLANVMESIREEEPHL